MKTTMSSEEGVPTGSGLETIAGKSGILALVVRRELRPGATTFVTSPDANFQAGLIVYPRGSTIVRHFHRPPTRSVTHTSEVLVF